MVSSSLKKDNLSSTHPPPSLHLGSHFIHLLTRPRFGAESSESHPGYWKLFPHGPHNSKNNFFGIKISQRRDWECPSLSYYGSWLSLLKCWCFPQVRGFRESFVAFVHKGSIVKIVLKIRSLYQLWPVMNCASQNLEVTVEISLVGFIMQSSGSELSDNVYFNVYISF